MARVWFSILVTGLAASVSWADRHVVSLPEFDAPLVFTADVTQYRSGLRAALWPDGSVLRLPNRGRLGRTYLLGKAKATDLQGFLTFMRQNAAELQQQEFVIYLHQDTRHLWLAQGGEPTSATWLIERRRDYPLLEAMDRLLFELELESSIRMRVLDPAEYHCWYPRDGGLTNRCTGRAAAPRAGELRSR